MQRAAEALWLGVRRTDGVDAAEVEARIGVPVMERFAPIFARQQASGLVALEGSRVRLVGEGLLLADQVGGDYLEVAI